MQPTAKISLSFQAPAAPAAVKFPNFTVTVGLATLSCLVRNTEELVVERSVALHDQLCGAAGIVTVPVLPELVPTLIKKDAVVDGVAENAAPVPNPLKD